MGRCSNLTGGSCGSFRQERAREGRTRSKLREKERERGGERGKVDDGGVGIGGGRSTVRNLWFISNRSRGMLEGARANSARIGDSKLFDSQSIHITHAAR